jgi:hypothetical protein
MSRRLAARLVVSALSFACLVVASGAAATPVTFFFEGVVIEMSGAWAGDGAPGDPVTGSFTYDLATPDENPSDRVGEYDVAASGRIELTVGSLELSSADNVLPTDFVRITYGQGDASALLVEYFTAWYSPDFDPTTDHDIRLTLSEFTVAGPGDALTSDALPASLDLRKFEGPNIGEARQEFPGAGAHLTYQITRLVPEASSVLLLAAGSVTLAGWRRGVRQARSST